MKLDIVWVAAMVECSGKTMVEKMVETMVVTMVDCSAVGMVVLLDDR